MSVVNDRPGRRARLALFVAGLLVAATVGVLGAAVEFLGAALAPGVVAALAGLAVLAGIAAGASAQARRSSIGVLVATASVAAVGASVLLGLVALLLLLGRLPAGAERRVVGPAAVAIVIAAACAGPFARRAARRTRAAMHAVRRSPDELLADFAENAGRGSPVDDLLRTLAESMRRDWQLSRVEVWTGLDDPAAASSSLLGGRPAPGLYRTLVVPSALDPDADPVPPPLDPAELGMLRRAGVAGPGWLRLWVPRLLDGREHADEQADRQLRFAPAVQGDSVLALVLIERPPDALPFSTADDRALAEVARRLAIVLRNRSLDEALQATLADLRQANVDLQASRRRLVTTADGERKRIERDLHDGAQQHLVALAVGIRLVRDSLAAAASPADLELLDELDRGVRESIGSLRDLAHGIYPPLLRDSGLEEALRAAAKRSPLAVTVSATDLGRHPEQVEAAIYFCCLEALANVGKHAPGASVTITLQAVPGELRFEVADDGPGFDPATTPAGAGLSNMADRIGALGGEVAWRASPGHGTVVVGRTPVPRRAPAPAVRRTVPVGD
ncbi:MAG TPA: histidine kinase [Pseudonocardia sp.]|jgi:signal transduction histidine kinase|nr:histidine kinase [Pseudonocardia sp.]